MSTEFLEELEALESVYSDLRLSIIPENNKRIESSTKESLSAASSSKTPSKLATKSSIDKTTISEDLYATILLYCTPRSSATSFVSAEVQLSVPKLYPLIRPSFKILKSSGLSDDGREIEAIVDKFIEESPPEECLLFQLVCLVYDFLDDCRIGECSICAEEIIEFNFQGISRDHLFQLFIRIFVPHCVHDTDVYPKQISDQQCKSRLKLLKLKAEIVRTKEVLRNIITE